MILPPCGFLGAADQIGARDVVIVANLGAADAGEEAFRAIREDAGFGAVEVLMVDPFDLEPAVQVVPRIGAVRPDRSARQNPRANPGLRRAFGLEHDRQRRATAFPSDRNHLAVAVLVLPKATIPAILFLVRGLHISAGIHTVDLDNFAVLADRHPAKLERHRFPDFVREDVSRLVLGAQIAGQRRCGLALSLTGSQKRSSPESALARR